MRPARKAAKAFGQAKSPWMMATVFGLWLVFILWFGPQLVDMLKCYRTIPELILLALYCLVLLFFWLMTAYYLSVLLFYWIAKPLPAAGVWRKSTPPIAILYATCNDLQEDALDTYLEQDYPNFHLFILDDSTEKAFQIRVDAYAAKSPKRITVVRRTTRTGFKAGNLNFALKNVITHYPIFAVVDADERLPEDFLSLTVPWLEKPGIAFAQACHMPNPRQESAFAHDIGPTIIPFWQVHCRPRNRYGSVVFMGHGALMKYDAWEQVGGFPEFVSEDFAFTMQLRESGFQGVYLEHVVCYEDFPVSYALFKQQQERYVSGSFEILLRRMGRLLRSKRVSLVEKLDFMLWSLPLYVPAIALFYVVLCCVGLPLAFGTWDVPTVVLMGREITLFPLLVIHGPFVAMNSLDFRLFSVICALSPTFATITVGLTGKLAGKRCIKLLALSTVVYLSLMVTAWRGILHYLFSRRVAWFPTGEKDKRKSLGGRDAPKLVELVTGIALTGMSLITANLAGVAISLSLIAGVLINIKGWQNKAVRALCVGCFVMILVQILLNILMDATIAPRFIPLIFTVHF